MAKALPIHKLNYFIRSTSSLPLAVVRPLILLISRIQLSNSHVLLGLIALDLAADFDRLLFSDRSLRRDRFKCTFKLDSFDVSRYKKYKDFLKSLIKDNFI